MMTSRYLFPIIFLLLDDTYNEIFQGKRDICQGNQGQIQERNLTRAQPKAHGCDYMGVALSMGLYKYDLVDTAQLST